MTMQDDATSSVNTSGTCQKIDAGLTQSGSPNVLRDLNVKRNLAEQSKWLNDSTGDRSWATHETQQMPWMMNVQVNQLAKEK